MAELAPRPGDRVPRVPIPPKGHLLGGHKVARVSLGWDVTIALRSLDLGRDLNEDEVAAVALVQLASHFYRQGVDVDRLMDMARE